VRIRSPPLSATVSPPAHALLPPDNIHPGPGNARISRRRRPGAGFRIGAGHHRVQAALEAGITHAELYVSDSFDDDDIVYVYTVENATQRGHSGTALAGSVAAALRLIAKYLLTGNIRRILQMSERGEQTVLGKLSAEGGEGLGRDLLVRYFHEKKIPGMGDWTVQQQMANLKASGAYARIMREVEVEIEREREEARQAAEHERQRMARGRAPAGWDKRAAGATVSR
jgi:hypothetical protein